MQESPEEVVLGAFSKSVSTIAGPELLEIGLQIVSTKDTRRDYWGIWEPLLLEALPGC